MKFYTFMEEEGELVEQEATRVEERLRTSKLVLRMYSTEGGSVTITSVSPPKGNTKWKVPLGDCKDVSTGLAQGQGGDTLIPCWPVRACSLGGGACGGKCR